MTATFPTNIAFLGDMIQARFLKEGDLVERHQGHTFRIGVAREVRASDDYLVFSATNELGGIVPLVIHPMVEVALGTDLS